MAELLNFNTLLLPLATSIGAFSVFPTQPKLVQQLAQNELFKWLMVFILIWQGGGGQRMDLSLLATAITFVLVKLLDRVYSSGMSACPAPAPAPPAEEE